MGGSTAGSAPAAAPASAPAAPPGVQGTLVEANDKTGITPMTHNAKGYLGMWGVILKVEPVGHWLIQHVQNLPGTVEHVDPALPYPPAAPILPEPTRDYYEAWWIDAAGKPKVPKSLTTPPNFSTSTNFFGDDIWNFSVRSADPTRGALMRRGELHIAPTLPSGFAFGTAPEAVELPSMIGAPSGLGPGFGRRTVLVVWDWSVPTSNPDIYSSWL